jgi:hypothetical protein
MKNTFIRRMIKTKYRPYPEDDTLVFKVIPYTNEVSFCWELPHRSNMLNMLNCPDLYPAEQLQLYRRWEMMQLECFGFMKDEIGNWKENPFYARDQVINKKTETQVSCSTDKIQSLPEAS